MIKKIIEYTLITIFEHRNTGYNIYKIKNGITNNGKLISISVYVSNVWSSIIATNTEAFALHKALWNREVSEFRKEGNSGKE